MLHEEITKYYGYLSRLAASKCFSQADAEDIISETMLAALAFIKRGGTIEFPKTWLANTLMHKYNSGLRRVCRAPVTVNLDSVSDISADERLDEIYAATEEAALVRRELIYLAQSTRETLIRHYYAGESVGMIAAAMGIPEGTVKSRLSAGRNKIKKGLEKMENHENHVPGRLDVSNSGSSGPKNEPASLVWDDLIAQNLLILAYEKPLSPIELARAIAIPTVYIEPILDKLVNGELMARTESGAYYSDFIIYQPEDTTDNFDKQLKFVRERFDIFWQAMKGIIDKIGALSFAGRFNHRQIKKLERYAITHALQRFELYGAGDLFGTDYNNPARKDGGRWTAMGFCFPADYNKEKYDFVSQYIVQGGHRTTGWDADCGGAKRVMLYEFDTTLWDNPGRFNICGLETYFNNIIKFLWRINVGLPLDTPEIPNRMIECIPDFITAGLLSREEELAVDIPVMDASEYAQVMAAVNAARDELTDKLREDYRAHLRGAAIKIPPHLKSVSEPYRYNPVKNCIVMAAIREAYDRGLHLSEVDYCCPPALLVCK